MAIQDTDLDGHYVPRGTPAMIAALPLHHDPDLWSDPDTFDPNRFGDDRRGGQDHHLLACPAPSDHLTERSRQPLGLDQPAQTPG
ncbi:MAG: cytochrome P450 [Euzebya sp.]